VSSAANRHARRIARQFEELTALTEVAQCRVERISGWSVGQHLHHLMKSDRSIFRFFPQPSSDEVQPVSAIGRIVLWSGWIPRGKGRAPAATEPEAPGVEELRSEIEGVRATFVEAIEARQTLLAPEPIANHPHFGGLNRVQWLRFVGVHHHHHTKIIRDVLRADPA